jgi:hypothetical protein
MNAAELQELLAERSGRAIDLTVTANRRSFVSFRHLDASRAAVRLQEAFLEAPKRALSALAAWIARGRGRCPRHVREFVNAAAKSLPAPAARPRRRMQISAAGRFHDLDPIFERVNRDYFGGAVSTPIGWGRVGRPGRRVRCRRLGSFSRSRGIVVINPVLDRPEVPEFFVEFIVYHEMLHAAQPPDTRRWHGPEFHASEKRHPHYAAAREWRKKHLRMLTEPEPREFSVVGRRG